MRDLPCVHYVASQTFKLYVMYRETGEGMSTGEEVVHLRRQLAKLNRRVMNLELECLQQQQREKILYGLVAAYFLVKGLFWMNRS